MREKFKSRVLARSFRVQRFSMCIYRPIGENGCRTERERFLVMVAAAAVDFFSFFFIAGSGAVKCSAVRCRHTRI